MVLPRRIVLAIVIPTAMSLSMVICSLSSVVRFDQAVRLLFSLSYGMGVSTLINGDLTI
jgi:hypothetical protein